MPSLKQVPPLIGGVDDTAHTHASNEHSSLPRDFLSMPSDQQQQEVRRIVREAHAARTRELRAACRSVFAWFQSTIMIAARPVRPVAAHVFAAIARGSDAYARRRRRLAAAEELRTLSDHDLKDIGIDRSAIDWVVTHGRDDWTEGRAMIPRPVLVQHPARLPATRDPSDANKQKRRAA